MVLSAAYLQSAEKMGRTRDGELSSTSPFLHTVAIRRPPTVAAQTQSRTCTGCGYDLTDECFESRAARAGKKQWRRFCRVCALRTAVKNSHQAERNAWVDDAAVAGDASEAVRGFLPAVAYNSSTSYGSSRRRVPTRALVVELKASAYLFERIQSREAHDAGCTRMTIACH